MPSQISPGHLLSSDSCQDLSRGRAEKLKGKIAPFVICSHSTPTLLPVLALLVLHWSPGEGKWGELWLFRDGDVPSTCGCGRRGFHPDPTAPLVPGEHHGITGWFWVGKDLPDNLIPCHDQGTSPSQLAPTRPERNNTDVSAWTHLPNLCQGRLSRGSASQSGHCASFGKHELHASAAATPRIPGISEHADKGILSQHKQFQKEARALLSLQISFPGVPPKAGGGKVLEREGSRLGMFPWSSEMSQCHLPAAVTRPLPNPKSIGSGLGWRGTNPSLTLKLPGSLWNAAPNANSPKAADGIPLAQPCPELPGWPRRTGSP